MEKIKMAKKETKALKLGVINIQAVVAQSPAVIALRDEEQAKRASLQDWVNARNVEIAAAEEANKAKLTQKYQAELNERQQAMQADYTKRVQEIDADLNKLIAAEAKKEELDYVFNVGSIIFGGKDITPEILEAIKK